jgi:membrane protein DedA with SNARE-associated domain
LLDFLSSLPPALVYLVVFVLVFGEAALLIGFVLPGEIAVIVGGAIASKGHVNVWLLGTLVVVAAITGDSTGYLVGDRYGERLLKLPVLRHRRAAINRALEGLKRRGPIYVFIGRFTALLRALMPGLAGMSRLQYRRFFVANASGGLLWGVGFTLLGYLAGTAIDRVAKYASWAGIGLLAAIIAFALWHHLWVRRRERAAEAAYEAAHPEDPVA